MILAIALLVYLGGSICLVIDCKSHAIIWNAINFVGSNLGKQKIKSCLDSFELVKISPTEFVLIRHK